MKNPQPYIIKKAGDFFVSKNMKNAGAMLIILLLFPYLAVVFTVGTLPVKERAGQMSPLEIYVCQITAGTLPADSADEFIKAQMVLVRTNAVREMQEQRQNPV